MTLLTYFVYEAYLFYQLLRNNINFNFSFVTNSHKLGIPNFNRLLEAYYLFHWKQRLVQNFNRYNRRTVPIKNQIRSK